MSERCERMKYDFDEEIERKNTNSSKWDGFEARFLGFNASGAIPMWVADMDFKSPKEVIEAVKKKADEGIYGYPCQKGNRFDDAVKNWLIKRHNFSIEDEWVVATQGVVPAVTYAVQAFTNEGDGVLIQPPVYYPFKDRCIKYNKRIAVENQLILKNGKYEIDFDDFEEKAKAAKLFILCSPHNPVGRVWTAWELEKMIDICRKENVIIFSDEIHSDLIMRGYKHVPTALVSGGSGIITAYAPSKTFNLAGLKTSAIVISDESLRKKFKEQIKTDEAGGLNSFGEAALTAAYNYGEDYLEQLIDYIGKNMDYAQNFANKNLKGVSAYKTEGTYFLWLDFRKTELCPYEINKKIIEQAKVAGDIGEWFGKEGAGFLRLNLACTMKTVKLAMERLQKVFG